MSRKRINTTLKKIKQKLNIQKRHIARAVGKAARESLPLTLSIRTNYFWNLVLEDFHFAMTCSIPQIRDELHRRGVDDYPALRNMYDRVCACLSDPDLACNPEFGENIAGASDLPEFRGQFGGLRGVTSLLAAIPAVPAPPGEPTMLGLWLAAAQQLLRNEYFANRRVMHDDSMYSLILMGVALSLQHVITEGNPFILGQLPIPLEKFSPQHLLLNDFVIQNATLIQPDEVWLVGHLLPSRTMAFCVYDIFEREKVRLYFPDGTSPAWVSQESYMTADFMRTMWDSLK